MSEQTIPPPMELPEAVEQTQQQQQDDYQNFSDVSISEAEGQPDSASAKFQIRLYIGIFVAACVLIMAVVAMARSRPTQDQQTQTTDTAEVIPQETPTVPSAVEAENRNLKAKQAFDDQEEGITNGTAPTAKPKTGATPTPAVTPKPKPSVRPQPRPVHRIAARPRPVQQPPRPRVLPQRTRPLQATTPVSQPVKTPKPDPFEQYQKHRQMLGFTSAAGQESQATTTAPPPVTESVPGQTGEEFLQLTAAELGLEEGNDSTPVIRDGKPIKAGEQFKAKLLTGAAWADDVPLEGATVLAQLHDPMGSLPEGSVITLRVKTASNAGFLVLEAKEVATDDGTVTLPQGLTVTASNGKPLQAKLKGTGGGFQLSDVLGIGLAGASQATAFINRDRTTTTLGNGSGISSTVVDRNQGNVLAAVGKGVADEVLGRARKQAEGVTNQRTPFWLVKEGQTIQILVTQNAQI